MVVKGLIESYGEEEIHINIYDCTECLLLDCWKTDYCEVDPKSSKYIYEKFHKYDYSKVDTWIIEDGKLIIYLDEVSLDDLDRFIKEMLSIDIPQSMIQ